MPERLTSLTGAAGEHFVAYKLSLMGYPVGLTRGGSPTVDIMVGDLKGNETISIQVKTSSYAWRDFKRKPENNHWEWDVGAKALKIGSKSLFYAFVDLQGGDLKILPSIFIVPSSDVKSALGEGWSRYMFWILKKDESKYLEKWELISKRLS
jgi:hypothetical protein